MNESKPSPQNSEYDHRELLVLSIPSPTIGKVELAAKLALVFLRILPWALKRASDFLQQASAAINATGLEQVAGSSAEEPSETAFEATAKAIMIAAMAGAWTAITDSEPELSFDRVNGSMALLVAPPAEFQAEQPDNHPVSLLSWQTLYLSLNLPDELPETIVIGLWLGQEGSHAVYESIPITEVDSLPDRVRQMVIQVWISEATSRKETKGSAKRQTWRSLKEWMDFQSGLLKAQQNVIRARQQRAREKRLYQGGRLLAIR